MILTSGELLEYMENTPPEEWPSPRGYGYGSGSTARRMKTWHIKVVATILNRMAGGDHEPRVTPARLHPDCVASMCGMHPCQHPPCYVAAPRTETRTQEQSDGE